MSASSSLPSTKPFSTPSRPRPPRFRPAPLWLQGLSVPFDAPLGPSVPPIHLQNRILRYTMYSTRHEAASNSQQYACMAAKRAPGSQKTASKHAESRVDGAGLETALEGVGWRIRNTRAGCTTSKARISKTMANSVKSRAEHPSAVENHLESQRPTTPDPVLHSKVHPSPSPFRACAAPEDAIHLHPPTCNARSQLSGPVQYPTSPTHESNRREHSVATANAPQPTHTRRSRSSSRNHDAGLETHTKITAAAKQTDILTTD
ncbi:hypothetical protein DFP72DRAFT_1074638 [Ephemerocybe angulata]|uniref:Uncharacterized protein n=1 Tax=Ephemerocybe angulata TaxID=980116 RepID=A0A8H6LZ13_9AGAR|nr:hypothetical protein DFP72DRAFT_1074638 [Tulosesus angulatus]